MRAAVIRKNGSNNSLALESWPDPTPGRGQVLVRVTACSLNHLDIFVLRGIAGLHADFPRIPGGDIAGCVEEVGPAVSRDWIGKRVLIDPHVIPGKTLGEHVDGGLCELIAVDESGLIVLPTEVGEAEAAALPISYGTARRMLRKRGRLERGEMVLILGASGGVGTACVQLASFIGAEILACAGSREKLERLRGYGAHHLIDYSKEDFSSRAWTISGKRGVDMVINFTGGATWVPSLRTLRKCGRLVTCGATAGHNTAEDLRYIWQRELSILGSHGWERGDLTALVDEVASGRLKPIIDREMGLEQVDEGFRMIANREVFGKIIIRPNY